MLEIMLGNNIMLKIIIPEKKTWLYITKYE